MTNNMQDKKVVEYWIEEEIQNNVKMKNIILFY